jgi:hypothetical protein
MPLFTLLFIILPAVTAETLVQREAIYGPGLATARRQPLLFTDADKCMTPYPDSQEAYEACCLGFDQAKVVLDGEQYTTNCRRAFRLNRTPQQELSGPVSCARQRTKTAGCKCLQYDMSKKCELPFNDLLTGSKSRDIVTMVRSQETPGEKYE